jgi:hypothetical protein
MPASGKHRSKKPYRWRISRIRGTPAQFIGFVDAPDDATAIKNAIEEFQITDPEKKTVGGAAGEVRGLTRRSRFVFIAYLVRAYSVEKSGRKS